MGMNRMFVRKVSKDYTFLQFSIIIYNKLIGNGNTQKVFQTPFLQTSCVFSLPANRLSIMIQNSNKVKSPNNFLTNFLCIAITN